MEKQILNKLSPILSFLPEPDDEYYCSIHDADVIPDEVMINRRKEYAIENRIDFLQ